MLRRVRVQKAARRHDARTPRHDHDLSFRAQAMTSRAAVRALARHGVSEDFGISDWDAAEAMVRSESHP